MKVTTRDFELVVPEGFVERPGEVWSALDPNRGLELTVGVYRAKGAAPIQTVLDALGNARAKVLRESFGAEHVTPVTGFERDDLRGEWMVAICKEALAFTATISHEHEAAGQRWFVTMSLYQYFDRSAGPPNVAEFATLAQEVLATVEPLPSRQALSRADGQGDAIDTSRIYPYVVPRGYLGERDEAKPLPASIGHDLFVAIAEDFNGAARIQLPENLGHVAPRDEIVEMARQNLVLALKAQKVSIQIIEGPNGRPAMLFGPEWLSASCLLVPDLHMFAAKNLGEGTIYASIPHRDAMVLFTTDSAKQPKTKQLKAMRATIKRNEADPPKPLTDRFFIVEPDKITPIDG